MWWSSQKSRNFFLVNCVPLSVMMEFGDPESMDDVGEERHRLLGPDGGQGSELDPLGEFVDGDQQVREAPGFLLQGTNEV
jgi:hypothetical protein